MEDKCRIFNIYVIEFPEGKKKKKKGGKLSNIRIKFPRSKG